MKRRILALLLSAVMLLGLFPAVAMAEDIQLSYDFESDTVGAAPAGAGWTVTTGQNANVTVETVKAMGITRALRLSDQSSTTSSSASAVIPFAETPSVVHMDIKAESLGYESGSSRRGFPVMDLLDSSGKGLVARAVINPVDDHTGVLAYYTGSGAVYVTSETTVSLDAWHTITFDVANRKILVDGIEAMGSAAFLKTTAPASLRLLTTGKAYLNDVFYVDNIRYTGTTTHTADHRSPEAAVLPLPELLPP